MIYQPHEDSYLLQKAVKKYAKNKDFLDMGAATGIQSETAKESGAKSTLAIDIDLEVIKLLKSKNLPAITSNLFSNINKNQKFDLIAFNPPYLPEDKREDKQSQLATTGGKRGDEIILKFLKQSTDHLNKQGIILLLVSSLTPHDRILSLIKDLGFTHKIIAQKKLFMEKLEVWEISKDQ
jgi:release factor glutamine methyltransferase